MTTFAPAPAILRAIASPMPLVEPVTTAVLPLRSATGSSFLGSFGMSLLAVAGQVVGDHRLARLRPVEAFGMQHCYAHILFARAPVFEYADAREVVVLRTGLEDL